MNNLSVKSGIKKYWLLLFIVAQPLLDVVAFFNAGGSSTVSGYIRLAIMVVMVVFLLFSKLHSRRFIIALAVIVAVYLLHIINCFRVGYLKPVEDLTYMVKVAYMPVMALCMCCFIQTSEDKYLVRKGLFINFILLTLIIILSYLTDSYTPTYDGKIGISGWVIDDNRCCHSDILSSLCIFAGYEAVESKKKWIKIILPILITVLLLTNGTKACYLTLFAITLGYPCFIFVSSMIKKEKLSRNSIYICVFFVLLFIASVFAYPYTPRYQTDHRDSEYLENVEKIFADEMIEYGYDIYNLSGDEIENNDFLKEKYSDYYLRRVYGCLPVLVETYGTDRIMKALDYTVDSTFLEDTREMKRLYASFIFDDSDFLTRLTGFEFSKLGADKSVDLENDWFAVFYYYGYIGFLAYILLIVYFVVRIIRVLRANITDQLTLFNFCLLLCFVVQLGLGYFSGAILRRPNASIYLSIVIALLYYQTDFTKVRGKRCRV